MNTLYQRALVQNSGIAFLPVIPYPGFMFPVTPNPGFIFPCHPEPGFIGVRDLLLSRSKSRSLTPEKHGFGMTDFTQR